MAWGRGRGLACCLVAGLGLLGACGDDGTTADGTESSTAGATAATMSMTAGPGTTRADSTGGGQTGSSGSPTSGSGSGTDTGTDTDASSGSGSGSGSGATQGTTDGGSSDGGSTTGAQGNVVYSAIALPGGLDRIRIHKADLDDDRCTWVILVAPALAGPYPGVTVPGGWSIESISINDVAAACAADNPFMFGSEAALDASGTIGFGMLGGGGVFPCTVDIDASFDFMGILPGIPPTDTMLANGIAVAGC